MKGFDIRLEKNEFIAGETLRGDVVLLTKGFKANNLRFYVCGEEKTKIAQNMGIPKNLPRDPCLLLQRSFQFSKVSRRKKCLA